MTVTLEAETDGALVRRCRSGDAQAATALYRRHVRGVYAFARSLSKDPSSAEDLVHDAFVGLLDPDGPEDIEDARAFLCACIRNRFRDDVRKTRVRGRAARFLATKEGGSVPTDFVDWVQESLDRLPEEQREAVILKIYTEMTFAEIAKVIGTSLPTAASRYRLGLEKMASMMTREVTL